MAIERFRGIKKLSWLPGKGVNVILGGGDVGKTTILDAIGLLFSPNNSSMLFDSDYYDRNIGEDFSIEAVVALLPTEGINYQTSPSWPWHWNGTEAVVPSEADEGTSNDPVYRLRVRGTPELELSYEIVQPDDASANLSVSLRRAIGLVRLSGDDRNDRDLRLVQGSALDRLLSDKGLRSRLAGAIGDSNVKERLNDSAKAALTTLNDVFQDKALPRMLDLGFSGSPGLSITALIGLTAERAGVQLPLASWGAGTRRFAALAIAQQNQGEAPITLVDEIERGLEPYRQWSLMETLQAGASQVFVTTHSPSAIAAASNAHIWYVDHVGSIARLDATSIERHRKHDPETFLARLTIVAEGATEFGFVTALLERAVPSSLRQYGIHVSDGTGHESTLNLLEALASGGLLFGGFVDEEQGKYPVRWQKVRQVLGTLLFRWASGCIEENVISVLPDDMFEALLTDPTNDKTGMRLRTLADRIGIRETDFESIRAHAGPGLRALILQAALGTVPNDTSVDKKAYLAHAQTWFKSAGGGRELAEKVFRLGVWNQLHPQLMPFCNAVRGAVGLAELDDLPP
ncbi:MAG: ATP-binding protein [Gemmatimonadota bacterium]|nr:ATP-binding protein [Gemmatimonadota bacterium]